MSETNDQGEASRFSRAMEVFDKICDLPASEHADALDRLCENDQPLRSEVEALLEHDARDGMLTQALNDQAIEAAATDVLRSLGDGTDIEVDGYEILGELGRGGMGVIYRARQQSPDRFVALKLLGSGFTSDAILRRFARESRVLGRLQHPGIAQIYEAGVASSPTGSRPFFSMELVEGMPLDRHADAAGLSQRDRLELLGKVCDAVGHANDAGVLHRDLKPANILVVRTEGERVGQPKVLDFGIARITDPQFETTTIETQAGEIIGTLAYMSPEQVSGTGAELDARCDVYALGAIAYELLTGERPLDLSGLPIPEAARVIRDEEPEPLTAHDRSLGGDVQTMISKAMDKDPSRRYASARAFAEDLRRHLAHRPIVARPASTAYQIGKFTKRNKGLVTGIAVAFVVLIGGVTATSIALADSLSANAALTESNERLTTLSDFQGKHLRRVDLDAMGQHMSEVIVAIAPESERTALEGILEQTSMSDAARSVLMNSVVIPASEEINAQFEDDPAMRGMLLRSVADNLDTLGQYDDAIAMMDRAQQLLEETLGPEDTITVQSLSDLSTLKSNAGDFEGALEPGQRAFDVLNRQFPDERFTMVAASNLARVKFELGRIDEAIPLYEDVLARSRRLFGSADRTTQLILGGLALALTRSDRDDLAEPLYREVLKFREATFGLEHESTIVTMNNLASLLTRAGKTEEAADVLERALPASRAVHGDRGMATLALQNNLAKMLEATGRIEDAASTMLEVHTTLNDTFGPGHPNALLSGRSYAQLLYKSGSATEALAFIEGVIDRAEVALSPQDPRLYLVVSAKGDFLFQEGQLEEAGAILEAAADGLMESAGPNHAWTRGTVATLVTVLETRHADDPSAGFDVQARSWEEQLE